MARVSPELAFHIAVTLVAGAGAFFYQQFQTAALAETARANTARLEATQSKLADLDKNLTVLNRLLIENGTIKGGLAKAERPTIRRSPILISFKQRL